MKKFEITFMLKTGNSGLQRAVVSEEQVLALLELADLDVLQNAGQENADAQDHPGHPRPPHLLAIRLSRRGALLAGAIQPPGVPGLPELE